MAARGLIHRLRLWWRDQGDNDRRVIRTSALAGAFLVLFFFFSGRYRSPAVVFENEASQTGPASLEPVLVDLTLLRNAKEKGAVCLDGSPPGYHFQRGWGSGANSWLLHLEGGGWCNSFSTCFARKFTKLGSSHYMEHQVPFVGILSHISSQNPDFYNWNKVKIRYCDGASFSGNVVQNGTEIFFRGQLIWEATMAELLTKGLADAKQALLTGCSAGGLATLIHCDDFRTLLPKGVKVKCLSDGGFFLDEKDITGGRFIRSFYDDVVKLQDVGKRFPDCTSKIAPSQCFFAHEIIKKIKTPVFVLNPAYDSWQIQQILVPEASDPQQGWLKCKLNIKYCDSNQIASLQGFRSSLLNYLKDFQHVKGLGIFINSCFVHCQTMSEITWHSPSSPRINNKDQTIAEAVGDWYFARRRVKEIDCPYPCNPTCYNMEFSQLYPLT